VSDLHAWPPQSSVDAAFKLFDAHRDYVRDLVHRHPGDEYEQLRALLQAEVFALDLLSEGMRQELCRPEPVEPAGRHREVGLTTDAWLNSVPGSLRRNQRVQ
jgi:hypothetical protein